jgi:4-hydroxy-3-methylbut-2-enyl diphosphate reductase IspH
VKVAVSGILVSNYVVNIHILKLGEISSEYCRETFLIETADELDKEKISVLCKQKLMQPNTVFTVGITAGASTPDDILEEVKAGVSETIITASGETTT